MSRRRNERRRSSLTTKAESLDLLIADASPLLDPAEVTRLEQIDERVESRAQHSADHTVIGFLGATGSGKSSLVNALTGVTVARVAHRRPTTSEAMAAIVDDPKGELVGEAHALLDWLQISERHVVSSKAGAPGTIYVDLPDFDSVEAANREVAERLADMVDVLVWVTDPEKYADGVLHSEFIQKFAAHDAVTFGVINQIDRLSAADATHVRASLEELLREDGLPSARALAVSAHTGQGIDELRRELATVAEKKGAALERLHADLHSEALRAGERLGATEYRDGFVIEHLADQVPEKATQKLEDSIAQAAQVPAIASAVGASYRQRASRATGWPALRWIGGFKVDPLKRMRIGITGGSGASESSAESQAGGTFVSRSSIAVDSPQAVGRMNRGLDEYVDEIVGDARAPWPAHFREVVQPQRDTLPDIADYALTHTDIDAEARSWWWTPINVLQWLALLAAVVGLGWLLALAAFDFFQVPKPPMPTIDGLWVPVPVPTALIAFGVLLGILLALLSSFVNRIAAHRRARKAERSLRASIRREIDSTIGTIASQECERATRIEQHLGALRE